MNQRLIITAIISVYLALVSGDTRAQEFTVEKKDATSKKAE